MFLSCGCKQNKRQTKTIVVNNETIIQEEMTLEALIGDGVPPFTRQEVQRAQDFLNGITNSYQEKIYLYEFHNKYHRETLQPSCSVCLPRITDRINQMGKILDNYDKKSL
jgi:hypothetical protein